MKFIIIGLGNFGSNLGLRLCDDGHEVIGIDVHENIVEELKDKLTNTVCMNSTDEVSLRSQPILEVDAVIVAIGEDWGASVQTAALLKELNVKRVIGRSLSALHTKVLRGLDIHEIVNPEEEAANSIANRIVSTKIHNSFNLNENHSVCEIDIPNDLVQQTVAAVDLKKNFDLTLVAIKHENEQSNIISKLRKQWAIREENISEYRFMAGDRIVVIGDMKNVERLVGR